MNNNVENYVEDTFDEMLDSVKSIHDDFINSYYETDELEQKQEKVQENQEFYDEKDLKELSNDMNSNLFRNDQVINKTVENYVEKPKKIIKTEEDVMNLIEQTTSSEEFFNILEESIND